MAGILANIGAFSNPFGVPSDGQWNLSRGVFTINNQAIVFFYDAGDPDPSQKTGLEQVTDGGGRRLAIYEYPYRDGQRVADLGRKGEVYTFNIKFFGSNYLGLLKEFLEKVVNQSGRGMLTHPVRSGQTAIPARFQSYEFVHQYGEWSAVTIKAVFVEDSTDLLAEANFERSSSDSALRAALQVLTNSQARIQQSIFAVGALLLLPGALLNGMKQRLDTISSQSSALLGKLAATFSSDAQFQALAAQAIQVGGLTLLTGGVNASASSPPVYQSGFDPATQSSINTQTSSFVDANQITPQQAVFDANQVRAAISDAIAEVQTYFGTSGYETELQYRSLAVSFQTAVEAAIASVQSLVVRYTVPYPMSLRTVAYLNGLTADDQNAIESLNPYLASVNYVPAGTVLTVPAA